MDPVPATATADRTEATLTPSEELSLVCGISASFQTAIHHADSKVNILVVVHPGITTILASQLQDVTGPGHTPAPVALVVVVALLVVFGVGFLAAGYHLVQALRPRTMPPSPTNRFAFPVVAQLPVSLRGAGIRELSDEAHQHNRLLAGIATTKNRHIGRAVVWVAVMLVTAVTCLTVAAVAG